MRRLKLLAAALAVAALAGAEAGGALAARPPAYGHVRDAADLGRLFGAIREEVGRARSRAELTRLYRRAAYLVTLTYSRPWRARFGDDLPRLRAEATRQLRATVQAINRRAGEIGTAPDYGD